MYGRVYDQFNVKRNVVSFAALIFVPLAWHGVLDHQSVVTTDDSEERGVHDLEWSGIHGGYGLVDGGFDLQHELLVAVNIGQLRDRKGGIGAV